MKQKSLFESTVTKSNTAKTSNRKGVKRATKKPVVLKPKLDRTIISLINRRQRQILLHSYIYYDLNDNIISDHTFDKWCFELVDLMNSYPNENKQSEFFSDFRDFDGSTGMDLLYKQPWTIKWATIFLSPNFKLNGGN